MTRYRFMHLPIVLLALILLTACAGASSMEPTVYSEDGLTPPALPDLPPAGLNDGQSLQVIATTSIIGDVVGRIGGDAIDLVTLMAPGQDPHSYEPSPGDLTRVADADVIIVNGFGLEASLLDDLENVAGDVPLVPISANVAPRPFGEHEEGEHEEEEHDEGEGEHEEGDDHDHAAADPHVWLDPHNVTVWADNVAQILSQLDPDNADVYDANAAAYQDELDDLIATIEETVGPIPSGQRKLVTNHDSLGYFADRFDFQVVGTVIPGASTLAEPSANAVVDLVQVMEEHGVCTLFAETSASTDLAETVAAELNGCDNVQVRSLYTGAIGPAGSGADSYIGMMATNATTIADGLR